MRPLPSPKAFMPAVRISRCLWVGDAGNGLVMVRFGVLGPSFLAGAGLLRSLCALRFPALPRDPDVPGAPRGQLTVAQHGVKEMK